MGCGKLFTGSYYFSLQTSCPTTGCHTVFGRLRCRTGVCALSQVMSIAPSTCTGMLEPNSSEKRQYMLLVDIHKGIGTTTKAY